MEKLTAQSHILFESRMYAPGEELPTKDAGMIEAWVSAGTAVWLSDEDTQPAALAVPATAEPGAPGEVVASESENGENLVGKIPKTGARKKG